MTNKDILNNVKKLRELTGVGFKDCKIAIEENGGDIQKSVEFLRKKGIAKASKKMSRTASEGLALVKEDKGQISIIEINSETDFVAKNKDFISFCKELSDINFTTKGDLDKLSISFLCITSSKDFEGGAPILCVGDSGMIKCGFSCSIFINSLIIKSY